MILSGATLVLLASLYPRPAEVPKVFTDLSFSAGIEQSMRDNRVLVLDAMTSWCAPCKQMDATTWIDPRLESWVGEHAIAIQLDMDENEDLKKSLNISAFPTIVLFRDGKEFDRVVGSRTAEQMLEWFGATMEGKRASDVALEKLAALRANANPMEAWHGRANLVEDLMWFGENEEALVEYEWLWRNLPSQTAEHARTRRWGQHKYSMRELGQRHPAARETFGRLRSEIEQQVASNKLGDDMLRDWIELNFVLDEEQATADWADAQVRTDAGVARVRSLRWRLFDLLIERNRWRTAGLTLGDVITEVTEMRKGIRAYDNLPSGNLGAASDKPKSMPAIPMMGGSKPVTPASDEKKVDSEKPGQAKSLPAIPMTGGSKPVKPTSDEKPVDPAPKADAEKTGQAKSMPAIPMIPMSPRPPATATDPNAPNEPGSVTKADEVAAEVRWRLSEQFRNQASDRYAALMAADRSSEAEAVAAILLDELNGPRTRARLVSTALRAGVIESAKSRHLQWLNAIAEDTSLPTSGTQSK